MSTYEDSKRTPDGDVDWDQVDATTDAEVEKHAREDDAAPGFVRRSAYPVYNFATPDVRAIRERLGCSQREFAVRFALSLRTIQQWEQGRAKPDQPAKVLLKTIEAYPNAVERAARAGIREIRNQATDVARPGATALDISSIHGETERFLDTVLVRRLTDWTGRPHISDPNGGKDFA